MSAPESIPEKNFFGEETRVSVSRLLSMLRKTFDMDVAFIGKFENGFRTAIYVDSKEGTVLAEGDPFCHEEENTYCKKIAEGTLPSIISDTLLNPTTRAMPVTHELSIGSYIGVPLYLSSGELFGTLCCMKRDPDYDLQHRDLSSMHFVAEVISDQIEAHRDSHRRIAEKSRRICDVIDKRQLQMHFQPIWSAEREAIAGFEALARFTPEPYRTPDVWFGEAAEVGKQEILESLAVEMALGELRTIPEQYFLSVNASPELVLSENVARVLDQVDAHRVILEITEHSKILSYHQFRDALQRLRAKGVKLAIDDAGAGYASLQHVLELDPDFIKLDLSLIRNIHTDVKKQALAAALISYARRVGAKVVAEGVETPEEFKLLRELNVDKIQGYLIGKPAPLADSL